MAIAYSTRLNFRRLESHTHAFWSLVAEDLAGHDNERILCIPQYTVTMRKGPNNQDPNISFESTTGKSYHERIPDFICLWVGRGLRTQPRPFQLVSGRKEDLLKKLPPPSNNASALRDWCTSAPHGYAPIPQPDISPLIDTGGKPDFWSDILNWSTSKVVARTTLFHMELKRPPNRHIETPLLFLDSLKSLFLKADVCSSGQRQLIFSSEPKLQRLITIMAVGEWWCFQISERGRKGKPLFTASMQNGQNYEFLDKKCYPSSTSNTRPGYARPCIPDHFWGLVPNNSTSTRNPSDTVQSHNPSDLPLLKAAESPAEHENNKECELEDQEIFDYNGEDLIQQAGQNEEKEESSGEESDSPIGSNIPMSNKPVSKDVPQIRYLRLHDSNEEEQPVSFLRQALPLSHHRSKFMLFGTPASNQRIYLIRELVKREAAFWEAQCGNSIS
ncbi:hypothetical protein CVT24_002579 [Panaeolus cyanescens]|uniref:Uncharacterized protein n=1 Tax=Panaeolus cyanescens TaxID=181874 RepID=A0A409WB53_9AGAR|nr:hypothetical protein CVT24_002579 [Panaeolus cyanescens]